MLGTADHQCPLRLQERPGGQEQVDRGRASGGNRQADLPDVRVWPGTYSDCPKIAL